MPSILSEGSLIVEYRRLGRAGLKLSALSLGAWVTYGGQVGEKVAQECMAAAYEAGVNFFDNAEAYAGGNAEIVMGKVIKQLGWRRESIVVSTKSSGVARDPTIAGYRTSISLRASTTRSSVFSQNANDLAHLVDTSLALRA